MSSLLLDLTNWDLCLDASGNIAVCTAPYSIAQDVATACRTFRGDVFYNTALGIPYFEDILGHQPPLALVKSLIATQAATVPGCNNPVVIITGFANRVLTGQIQFTDSNGATQTATINASLPQAPQMQDSSGNLMTDSSGNPMFGSL